MLLLVFALSNLAGNFSALANPQPEPDDGAPVRGGSPAGAGNLLYRGGPVLSAAHTVYFIYWLPGGYSVSSRYRSLIDGFMGNVAADGNKATNVYSSVRQYKDAQERNVVYQLNFGGSVIDTSPFPASGCTNPTTAVCLNDTQIRSKLATIMSNQGWVSGFDKIYFLMLPKNVGSCYDGTNAYCSFVQYCGYHSFDGPTSSPVLYSLIPYAATNVSNCGSFSHPNGDEADSTINIISHEHGEIMTDPLHNAWFNSVDRKERSDKCAWNFGQYLGWTAYGKFNQMIGTGKYYLQAQWSNRAGGCVLNDN